MNLQPILIIGLVLAALLYTITIVLYRRKGMQTKAWYGTIGGTIFGLLLFALLGLFGVLSQLNAGISVIIVAALSSVTAWRWQPPKGII
jgi:uncharacterized membrane protein